MYKQYILILSFLCLLLSACDSQYTDNPILIKAESLLKADTLVHEHADSAYKLLNNIPNPKRLSKADYAAWCLLYTNAQYQLYMDIKSDSLIKVAVNYYAGSKLKKQSGTSYYLLGCILKLLNQNDKAMLAYKQAYAVLDGTGEYFILGKIVFNMGHIYLIDYNYTEANSCFKKSLKLLEKTGMKEDQISPCLEISCMSDQLGYSFDSVLFYSNKALKLAKEVKDTVAYYSIISAQGELYHLKNSKLAINRLLVGFNHCPELRTRTASFLCDIYSNINKPDSATFYWEIARKEKREDDQLLKYLCGAQVYENRKDFKQAYYFINKAYCKQDSISQNSQKKQLLRIDSQFDLSQKEKANSELKINNRNKIIWIGFLIILLLITLVILQRVNALHKKKQAELVLKQQKIEFELREKELELRIKHDSLLYKLQQRIEMTLRFKKLQQGGTSPRKQEEFIELIIKQVVLAENEWQYYIDESNLLYNNEITDLQDKYTELTQADIFVVILTALGISISDSCILLNMSKETMYTRRKRIKKRLKIDADTDLEEWIISYFGKPY